MRRTLVIAGVAFAGLLQPAGAAELSPADAVAARKIYEVKCAKCHKFYEPSAYAQPEWDEWMVKMSKKSRLKPDQRRLLLEFLDDSRRKAGAPGAK
ncbi:MAG: hypothetical protein HY301_18910 [Verrucomicrobia bacterium]|nr:hypothetical protein [Verrucomicrobiota bacterium]